MPEPFANRPTARRSFFQTGQPAAAVPAVSATERDELDLDSLDLDALEQTLPLAEEPMSLRAYLAKHLQQQADEAPPAPSNVKPAVRPAFLLETPVSEAETTAGSDSVNASPLARAAEPTALPANSPFQLSQNAAYYRRSWNPLHPDGMGHRLNSLDTELSAGLEQYLPTPEIRAQVVKDRLTEEIQSLQLRLERYKTIQHPSAEVLQKMEQLEQRLHTLRQHEAQVDAELSFQLSHSPWTVQLLAGLNHLNDGLQSTVGQQVQQQLQRLSPEALVREVDPERKRLYEMNQTLSNLQTVLKTEVTGNTANSAEISDILNHYDQVIREAETLVQSLSSKTSLWDRFNHTVQGWYKKSYQ
ncbi:MAG: hypothetical protein SFZ03_06155 [Candidatus Melainabacteria bacterium]|nr:hypothetical protein [Candidatus Melainabacteria bacterium]